MLSEITRSYDPNKMRMVQIRSGERKREGYESWMRSKACRRIPGMVSQHEPSRAQADGGLNVPTRSRKHTRMQFLIIKSFKTNYLKTKISIASNFNQVLFTDVYNNNNLLNFPQIIHKFICK